MEKNALILDLFKRYQAGACSEWERELIEKILFEEGGEVGMQVTDLEQSNQYQEKVWVALQQGIAWEQSKRKRVVTLRQISAAAAVLVVMAVAGFYFTQLDRNAQRDTHALASNAVLPGGHKATLTFADGTLVELSEEQTGIVVGDGITYLDGSAVSAIAGNQAEMLTIATPKGGTYRVTLSDGSQIWLNSASTLKYPTKFGDGARVVELEGEAFFDVQPVTKPAGLDGAGSQPFKVLSKGQAVEVLGTAFNISAYPEDRAASTTLVEGRVKVTNANSEVFLTPNQQANLRGGDISVQDLNVEPYISWKSGRFSFDGKPFEQIMDEMARWYDLDVAYEGKVPTERFIGGAFRNSDLTIVLAFLESAHIEYILEGDRRLVIKNTGKTNGSE